MVDFYALFERLFAHPLASELSVRVSGYQGSLVEIVANEVANISDQLNFTLEMCLETQSGDTPLRHIWRTQTTNALGLFDEIASQYKLLGVEPPTEFKAYDRKHGAYQRAKVVGRRPDPRLEAMSHTELLEIAYRYSRLGWQEGFDVSVSVEQTRGLRSPLASVCTALGSRHEQKIALPSQIDLRLSYRHAASHALPFAATITRKAASFFKDDLLRSFLAQTLRIDRTKKSRMQKSHTEKFAPGEKRKLYFSPLATLRLLEAIAVDLSAANYLTHETPFAPNRHVAHVIDDSLSIVCAPREGAFIGTAFDEQNKPLEPLDVIVDGALKTLPMSAYSASRVGAASNGRGWGNQYADGLIFPKLKSKNSPISQDWLSALNEVEDGYLVLDIYVPPRARLSLPPESVTLLAPLWYIQKGKIVARVNAVTLTMNPYELLRSAKTYAAAQRMAGWEIAAVAVPTTALAGISLSV